MLVPHHLHRSLLRTGVWWSSCTGYLASVLVAPHAFPLRGRIVRAVQSPDAISDPAMRSSLTHPDPVTTFSVVSHPALNAGVSMPICLWQACARAIRRRSLGTTPAVSPDQ
ncbi:hypothetical protein CONLIGDRAFT_631085 [Coniochaeta ligniaria NRRL 30616]|uniref:Uncharacterized protein n=1 Tax=Coniochaeta ligniaria NRRL 30616 TaxID=1408157 RepID=A0A1J7JTV9_9PEZI|nr:hypothetical protein CONLIGDRAFT_631085 [Coniochaeta ligniaria NRRL 30616]